MTTHEITDLLRSALSQHRGDNLARAKSAWRNATPAQMQEVYSGNGETRQQLMDAYQAHEDRCNEAAKWLEKASE